MVKILPEVYDNMEIKRDYYLNKLIAFKNNGLIKTITGIKASGKSYLLNTIFYNYLLECNVLKDHIIRLSLDEFDNVYLRDAKILSKYIKERIIDKDIYYVLLDEIQLVDNFEGVLNGLLRISNIDIYVTGSNSKYLLTDIITEFRGRTINIKVYPLSFYEFMSVYKGEKIDGWLEYITYGGMPYVLTKRTEEEKRLYLNNLFKLTYLKDIIDRNNIKRVYVLNKLVYILALYSFLLSNTFISHLIKNVSVHTISSYINYLLDAFIAIKVKRYDIKGKRYISTYNKYYFTDIGLRNAILNFRGLEENQIIKNIIYNELIIRGYSVDVGVVKIRERSKGRKQLEVDFVCNLGYKRYYIKQVVSLDTREKTLQEEKALMNINDNFKKIIVVRDTMKHWYTEEGILVIGIWEFLLNKDSLDY